MTNTTKKKRYYQKDEFVWSIEKKAIAKVVSIDTNDKKISVELKDTREIVVTDLWKVDKLRSSDSKSLNGKKKDVLFFAKTKEDAIIPSKIHENAGYDFYACLEGRSITEDGKEKVVKEMILHAGQANLVPTGIASSMLPKYYLNMKHERGLTGKYGMAILSGVVDSGYRGEIFINIIPLFKDILITSEVDEVEELENVILYPLSKAIAQATLDFVPDVEVKEISYEKLKAIPSQRGDTKLGQSGK